MASGDRKMAQYYYTGMGIVIMFVISIISITILALTVRMCN